MGIAPLLALLVESALAVSAALLARRAKPLAILLGAAAFLVVPWFAGSVPLLRGLASLVGGVSLLRVIDLVRVGDAWSATRRVFHVISAVDSRTLKRERPRVDLRTLGRALLWAALATSAFRFASARERPVRWLAGLVIAYAVIEAGYSVIEATYRVFGFVTERLHVWPIASLSVGELWGVRWARPISLWLRETCFRPLARRRLSRLGLFLGFVISAVGHGVPVYIASDGWMALSMFGFFIVQGIFVVLETRLGVARWSRPVRRVWTIVIMLGTAPLFIEPALRVLGYS